MALPTKTVELEIDENAQIQPFFTLDSPTLGILDDPTGESILGSLAYVDVTQHVIAISTNRGINRQLERFNAGQANVVFDNTQRLFDPLGTSPFSGQLKPRRGIRVFSNGTPVFTGIVDDWNLNYNPNGDNTSEAVSSDKFTLLAQQNLVGGTATPQLSGARIEEILDLPEVSWPISERDIDAGQTNLIADVIDEDTVALDYLNLVTTTEQGSLFIAKDGKLTFQDNSQGPTSQNLLTFADDGTGIQFNNLSVIYGSELLYNRVSITPLGLNPQIVEDATSQALYGITTYSLENLLMDSELDALSKAQYLLNKYKDPEYRFETLTVELAELSTVEQDLVLSKEIGQTVKVKFTPNGIGAPIEKFAEIIGISHDIGNFTHTVTFNFDTLDFAPLILDDAVFGVLGGTSDLYGGAAEQTYEDSSTTYDSSIPYVGTVPTTGIRYDAIIQYDGELVEGNRLG